MINDVQRVWQVATWVDKLFLILWPAAAIVHILSGNWLIAGLAVAITLADYVILQHKATAAAWKAKYEAAITPSSTTYIANITSKNVDESLRRAELARQLRYDQR